MKKIKALYLSVCALALLPTLIAGAAESTPRTRFVNDIAERAFNHQAPYSKEELRQVKRIVGTLALYQPYIKQRISIKELVFVKGQERA